MAISPMIVNAVKGAYPKSITWSGKVDKMTEAQILAIYFKLRSKGKVA